MSALIGLIFVWCMAQAILGWAGDRIRSWRWRRSHR